MTQYLNVPGLEALSLEAWGLDAVDPILHPLILALPFFVLATLIALLVRLMRARKRRRAEAREAERDAARKSAAPRAVASPVTLTSQTVAAAPPPAAPHPAPLKPTQQPPAKAADPIAALQSQIDDAMKIQPNATLAPMFLEMARHHQAAGNEGSYLAALRSAAGLAAQHGPRATHAEARLQLAEAAFVAGDLTGACEQWQMARDALHADGQKDAHARVDQRMRDNGCPTDWVLTDF